MARICDAGGRVHRAVPARRWPGSRTPSTSSRGAPPGPAGDPARDDVRAHGDRQPAGERLPGHQPVRAGRPRLLQRRRRADRPRRATAGARWTPRSSSAPRTSTAAAGCGSAVGATLVRHSDPASRWRRPGPRRRVCSPALGHDDHRPRFADHPRVRAALERPQRRRSPVLAARRARRRPAGPAAGRAAGAGGRRRGHLHRDARPPAARAGAARSRSGASTSRTTSDGYDLVVWARARRPARPRRPQDRAPADR